MDILSMLLLHNNPVRIVVPIDSICPRCSRGLLMLLVHNRSLEGPSLLHLLQRQRHSMIFCHLSL